MSGQTLDQTASEIFTMLSGLENIVALLEGYEERHADDTDPREHQKIAVARELRERAEDILDDLRDGIDQGGAAGERKILSASDRARRLNRELGRKIDDLTEDT